MYGYFAFDIDGTLIDTERTCVLSLVMTVKQLMDKDITEEEAYGYFGYPSVKVGELLKHPNPQYFCEEWEKNFMEMSHLICVFEGVEQVLSDIKASGCKIGCVTSRNRFEFGRDVHLAGILHFFDLTICAEDSERHKPFPDPMLAFIDKMSEAEGRKINPRECIYIGDTMGDCLCGHDAGCDFALVDWRNRGMQGIPAEYHFTVPSQISSTLL